MSADILYGTRQEGTLILSRLKCDFCEITLLSLVPPKEGCIHNIYSDSRRGVPKSLSGHDEEMSSYLSQEPNYGSRRNLCSKPPRTLTKKYNLLVCIFTVTRSTGAMTRSVRGNGARG